MVTLISRDSLPLSYIKDCSIKPFACLKHLNGLIEQDGNTTTNGVSTITFGVVFANTPSISVCGNYNNGSSIIWSCLGYDLSTTGFKFSIGTTTKKTWIAKGY